MKFALIFFLSAISLTTGSRTFRVGPGAPYSTPCQAFKDAQDGDIIEIDAAGNYDGDVCRISANRLVIRGINGRARIYAAGRIAEKKAIWVVGGNDTTIENIEFSGCKGPNLNGAGIRQEGTNLTVRYCSFRNNENGILCGANPDSEILVENTEFAYNGHGDGLSHNIYIGNIRKFTMKACYSHHARIGHLVKSRAEENHIVYNRLTSEGNSSYELDLPNGGSAYIVGNIIQQSVSTENNAIIAFGEEGPVPESRLILINNTIVNDNSSGLFIKMHPMIIKRAMIVNNIFAGPGEVCSQDNAIMLSNFIGEDPGFVGRAWFNYGLAYDSECLDAGTDLLKLELAALVPQYEYVHPCKIRPRIVTGTIDIGAFEK